MVHAKRLKANSRINNDITTDEPFSLTLDVNKTTTLWVEADPYSVGRKEKRPLAIDVVKGSHTSMRIRGAFEGEDDEVIVRSRVKSLSDFSASLKEGRDRFTLESGVRLKRRNYLNIGTLDADKVVTYVPHDDIDKITLPQKIKGSGELLIEGFGEEDIIKIGASSYSYEDIDADRSLIPNWLLIKNLNWFNWMNSM